MLGLVSDAYYNILPSFPWRCVALVTVLMSTLCIPKFIIPKHLPVFQNIPGKLEMSSF